MNYKILNQTWYGLKPYDLNGQTQVHTRENYSGPVTLSLPEWQEYVASGKNTLYGSGGVIPGSTQNLGWVGNAVYSGHVRQGYR